MAKTRKQRKHLLALFSQKRKQISTRRTHKGGESLNQDLLKAVRNKNARRVEMLINRGANPNTLIDGSRSPLILAVVSKSPAVVKVLIRAGANLNYEMPANGTTALRLAAGLAQKEIVELLCEAGAAINAANKYGNAAIHIAIENKEFDIVRILAKHRADVMQTGDPVKNPVTHLITMGEEDLAIELMQSPTFPMDDYRAHSNAIVAIAFNCKKVLEYVLNKRPEIINQTSDAANGFTLLNIAAAKSKQEDILRMLLSKGANQFIDNYYGLLPVDYLTGTDMEKLFEVKADAKTTKSRGVTTQCFDPYMVMNDDITADMAVLHVYDPEKRKVTTSICVGEDAFEAFFKGKDNLAYRCKPHVPKTAIMIPPNNVEHVPLRKIAANVVVYMYESEARKVQMGHQYILKPIMETVGRLASRNVVLGGSVVSDAHCQNEIKDPMYEVLEYRPTSESFSKSPRTPK